MHPSLHRRSFGQCEELFFLYNGLRYVIERVNQRGYIQRGLYHKQPRRTFSSYVNIDYDICNDRIYRINICGFQLKKIIKNEIEK